MAVSNHFIFFSPSSTLLPTLILSLIGLLPSAQLSTSFHIIHHPKLRISAISASPAVLPYPTAPYPHHRSDPPALSPDISPLFPTPAGSNPQAPSPSSSSGSGDLPIIPSNPSPPNPDAAAASSHRLPEVGDFSPTETPVSGSLSSAASSVVLNPLGLALIIYLSVVKMGDVGFW